MTLLGEKPRRRKTDGFLGALTRFWEWIDERDIDKHATALTIIGFMLYGTARLLTWGARYAEAWLAAAASGHAIPGSDVALVIGAIGGPFSLVVGAVIPTVTAFYFKARQ